jgi:MFS family permease
MIGSALNIAMIPVFGAISDRIGRKKTFFFGAGVVIVSAWRALRVFSNAAAAHSDYTREYLDMVTAEY